MPKLCKSLIYSMLLLFLPVAVQAQTTDDQGNYYRNESPVQAPNRLNRIASGSLWRVIVDGLNCRQQANINSPIVRTYLAGELLEVEVYRGGSDEVLINPIDRSGKPWMPVRGANSEDVCYVRANSRYIQPVMR
ncbi:hypothetical protein H6F42_18205 [Pseudanabaena sp. FACHB-1998]|uniref:hypothetical protein n=1 Tax=Pseudanabaena sp. FACHB-1998 TaxID=2692858 RepID=UPI001681BAAB|nr:hypothetical protein [Pseudanabaena sp. FACHB-1998]MBD2178857.1 hypothetical protein [Pseudanabaena sp. FACHB-1998]